MSLDNHSPVSRQRPASVAMADGGRASGALQELVDILSRPFSQSCLRCQGWGIDSRNVVCPQCQGRGSVLSDD